MAGTVVEVDINKRRGRQIVQGLRVNVQERPARGFDRRNIFAGQLTIFGVVVGELDRWFVSKFAHLERLYRGRDCK